MENSTGLPTVLTIAILNDDCLLKIFHHLSLKDQFALTKTCVRFESVIKQMIWRIKFRSVYFDMFLREAFQEKNKEIIGTLCEFIEEVYSSSSIERMLNYEFPRLVSLTHRDSGLNDSEVALIAEKCPKLRTLRIDCKNISGVHIHKINNLRELCIESRGLQAVHVKNILKHLELTYLVMRGSTIPGEAFSVERSLKLQHLQLSEGSVDPEFVDNLRRWSTLECLIVTQDFEQISRTIPSNTILWQSFFDHVNPRITKLQVNGCATNSQKALNANTCKMCSLHTICVQGVMGVNLYNSFIKLPALKKLQVVFFYSPLEIINFVAQVKSLESIEIFVVKIFNLITFAWMLELVDILNLEKDSRHLSIDVYSYHFIEPSEVETLLREVLQDVRYRSQSLLTIKRFYRPHVPELKACGYISLYFK